MQERKSEYPTLQKNFYARNFTVIVDAIKTHFSDLFDLSVLEEIAKKENERKNNNYYALFSHCMSWIGLQSYTTNEVVEDLASTFNTSDTRSILFNNLLFVGVNQELKGDQLGYLERVATKKAKPAEALSFIDMLRFIAIFRVSGKKPVPQVFNLAHLLVCSKPKIQTIFCKNNSIILNLNQNNHSAPKWAAIYVGDQIQIYCEATLLETEKGLLEELIKNNTSSSLDIKYEGQIADGGVSSGYLAVAWLKNSIGISTYNSKYGCGTESAERLSYWSNFWSMREVFLHVLNDVGNEFDSHRNINVSDYHSKKTLGFFLKKNWQNTTGLSILYEHDLLETGKNLSKLDSKHKKTKNDKELKEYCEEFMDVVLEFVRASGLVQKGTFAGNQDLLTKNNVFNLDKVDNSITLKLPENVSEYKFSPPCDENKKPSYLLLAVFNDAAARCKSFIVEASGEFELTDSEYKYILSEMEYNAFLQQFEAAGDSASLKTLQNALTPVLARNRWLAINHYKPPLMGDHWQVAARDWLKYLYQNPNVLLTHENYQPFKAAVAGMGEKGLERFLSYLSHHRQSIEMMLGETKPPFYLSVGDEKNCNLLIKHLKEPNAYFPFSEIGIGYDQQAADDLITLLTQLNQQEQLSCIQLMNVPNDEFNEFLTQLTQKALEEKWTTLIIVEGLTNHSSYAHLNNIILHNRREKLGQVHVQTIEKILPSRQGSAIKKVLLPEPPVDRANFRLELGEDQGPWPLRREGTVQLQLQYQQQVQQQHQLEQKQQTTQRVTAREVALQGSLVSYANIDQLLGEYYQKLQNEFPHLQQFRPNLQEFFAALISANPDINAPHVIRYMTLDTAEYLLYRYFVFMPLDGRLSSGLNTDDQLSKGLFTQRNKDGRLSSGLNTDDQLSKGLFTQRTKDGDLVLCYDPELDSAQQSTPLTLDLDFIPPTAVAWQGDFRQLDRESYLQEKGNDSITTEDLHYMAAFAALQPEQDYTEAIQEFRQQESEAKNECVEKIVSNWSVYTQARQYVDKITAQQAIYRSEIPIVTPELALLVLLADKELVIEQLQQLRLTDSESRALGQLYYHFGSASVSLLINQLHAVSQTFPDNFYQFKQAFLVPCQNMRTLCSPAAILTLQALCKDLSSQNYSVQSIWWQLSVLHAQAVGFERPEKLWQGFQYFVTELRKEGVDLTNLEAFQTLKPTNMLVWMDRVLACIRQIPSADQKQSFLDQIHQYDLSHGGLPYALQYEGFKRFDVDLQLRRFQHGQPTYAPCLAEIFNWPEDDRFALQIKRLLATQSGLTNESYTTLCNHFIKTDINSAKSQLICLLLIQHSESQETAVAALTQLAEENPAELKAIAKLLHKAVYQDQRAKPAVSLAALVEITKQVRLLEKLPTQENLQITWLEAATVLHQRGALNELDRLTQLMGKPIECPENYPPYLLESVYQLAALFGQYDQTEIEALIKITADMKPAAKQAIDVMVAQLLSVDWEASAVKKFDVTQYGDWYALIISIKEIKCDLANAEQIRINFLAALAKKCITFKHSKLGDMRALIDEDKTDLDFSLFVDHETRLWKFLQAHIAIPTDKNAAHCLRPLLTLLKQLQLKKGYVNEMDQLLSALEKLTLGNERTYWHVDYFCQLLQTLQPEDDRAAYPLSMLKGLLTDPVLAAKPMDQLSRQLPDNLHSCIKSILQHDHFTRKQKAQLCTLALREFSATKQGGLTQEVIDLLCDERYRCLRSDVLKRLIDCTEMQETTAVWGMCNALLQRKPSNEKISQHWSKTCEYWLKASSGNEIERALFESVMATVPDEKKIPLLHIIAFSTLYPGLKSDDDHQDELTRKAPTLVGKLKQLNKSCLDQLADYYPTDPGPTAHDLLRILKKSNLSQKKILLAFQAFERNSHAALRADYARVDITREADLQRLLNETRVEQNHRSRPLTDEEKECLTDRFELLKRLESGDTTVPLANKKKKVAIKDMTKQQLAQAFQSLPKGNVTDEQTVLCWALCFEALGRISKKYPHLAQQFGVIVTDLLPGKPKIALFDTGEGKSHFNVLRALHYIVKGKKVHIHSAKRSLVRRDLAAYQKLFHYLNVSSACLTPDSPLKEVEQCQVVYMTTGDFSLSLDKQSYQGQPITPDPNWVGLFDEVHFIRFDEGLNTEYIFAIPDGKTPEQMRWFYRVLGAFCKENEKSLVEKGVICSNDLEKLVNKLAEAAGEHTSKQTYVAGLAKNPLRLLRWVQAAHESLWQYRLDCEFFFSSAEVCIGEESYPLRQIIPISSGTNQAAIGSTFTGGAQQVLAEQLNVEAMHKGKPQDFDVPPLSDVISAQVAGVCVKRWYGTSWEGTTGSLSGLQADALGATVIRIPTNRPCLRDWKPIQFFATDEERLQKIVHQTKACLEQKESILFTCKDDISAKDLFEQLKMYLTPEEFNQLLCFTNSSGMSTEEILEKKKELEGWSQGKKQRGVGLIASGLGLGDNVDVDVVIIGDPPKDENKLIQEGGRTARNGEKGSVYQFYLKSKIESDYNLLLKMVTQQDKEFLQHPSMVALEDIRDPEQKVFKAYLILKERVTFLTNEAAQAYRAAKAEYSNWGMAVLACLADKPEQRDIFQQQWILALQKVDEKWLTLSSDTQLKVEEKIDAIRRNIDASAEQLFKLHESTVFTHARSQIKIFKLPEPFEETKSKRLGLAKSPDSTTDHTTKPALDADHIFQQTRVKIAKHYCIDEKSEEQIATLLQEAAEQAGETPVLQWLGQWEKLTRDRTKEENCTFLIAITQLMRQCNTPESTAAFDLLLNKTLAWWNKGDWSHNGNKKYQDTLFKLWLALPQHSQTTFTKLINLFELQQPGKLGFTWLHACTQLSPELLSNNGELIQLIIPYLATLPGRKQAKIRLFAKIIDVIQGTPQQLLLAKQIQYVIKSFPPEGIERIINSQLLLLPRRLQQSIKISPESLTALNEAIIKFLAQSKWSAQQIDIYLEIIDNLLCESSYPLKLTCYLLHFQQQCCGNDFDKTIDCLTLLQNHLYLQKFFCNDAELNSRFLAFVDFIKSTKVDENILNYLADFYFDKKLQCPNYLSAIFCICVDKETIGDETLYKTIVNFNRFSPDTLLLIKNTFSQTAKPHHIGWLLTDLTKASTTVSRAYIEKLSVLYPALDLCDENDLLVTQELKENFLKALSKRKCFEALTFNQSQEFLELIDAKKLYLIPHLLSFFPIQNNKEKEREDISVISISPEKSVPLAKIFVRYEATKSEQKTDFNVDINDLNNDVNLVKKLTHFSAKQLNDIYSALQDSGADEMTFILSALANLTQSPLKYDIKTHISHLTQCYAVINTLESDKKQAIEKCLSLKGEALSNFLDFLSQNVEHEIFTKRPAIISYVADVFSKEIDNPFLFAKIFLLAAQCLSDKMQSSFLPEFLEQLKHLYEFLCAKNYTDANLPLFKFINKNPLDALQLVSDHFFAAHSNIQDSNEHKKYRKVIANEFYAAVRKCGADVNQLEKHSATHFEFDDKHSRTFRILWMRLLLQGAFISQSSELNPWTKNENNLLLSSGFSEYAKEAGKILGQQEGQLIQWKIDLPIDQASLLTLAKELQLAHLDVPSSDKLPSTETSPGIIDEMKSIIDFYADMRKSGARETQLTEFQTAFNRAKNNGYPAILEAIVEAREKAIQADKNACEWFFKLNRKGNSRYLDTLRQLEDIALQGWATNMSAVTEFHHYCEHFKTSLVKAILELSNVYYEHFKTSLNAAPPNKVYIPSLLARLDSLVPNAGFDPLDLLDPQKYTLALAQLEHDLPHLPGHLRTLANPLIKQIKVYLTYCDAVSNISAMGMAKLFIKIDQLLDSYAALGGKSPKREQLFAQLKDDLAAAISQTEHCGDELKKAISGARLAAIREDTEQYDKKFFPPHYRGDSRYLNLLHELDKAVMGYSENIQWKQEYLEEKFTTAIEKLSTSLVAFHETKKTSVFWKKDCDTINGLIRLLTDYKNNSENELPKPEKLSKKINEVIPLLPGYLQVLAREVLKTIEQPTPVAPRSHPRNDQ